MRYVLVMGLVLGISGAAAAAEIASGPGVSILDRGAAQLGGAQRLGGTEIMFSPPSFPAGVGQSPTMVTTDDVEAAWRERLKDGHGKGAVKPGPIGGEGKGSVDARPVDTYPDEERYPDERSFDHRVRDQPPNDEGAY